MEPTAVNGTVVLYSTGGEGEGEGQGASARDSNYTQDVRLTMPKRHTKRYCFRKSADDLTNANTLQAPFDGKLLIPIKKNVALVIIAIPRLWVITSGCRNRAFRSNRRDPKLLRRDENAD